MVKMKKTAIAAALALGMAGTAQASLLDPITQTYVTGDFDFVGHFVMLDSTGGLVGDDPGLTGSMHINPLTLQGTATMASPNTFFGYNWTAHNITLQMTGPNTVHADMLFDWGVNPNIHATADFQLMPSLTHLGGFDVTTLDGDGDGIQGNAMDNGPFVGFNATFNGLATVSGGTLNTSAIPVPAAAWLLGSGLAGLLGFARKRAFPSC